MKFGLSLLATAILAATVQAGENPDCKLTATDGYGNCKNTYFVNGEGSDVIWCVSRSDCEKVFPQYTPAPTANPTNAPVAISSIEEAVTSSSTMARASKAAYLAAAVAALW